MKIEEGSILINNKIIELKEKVKKIEQKEKIKYIFQELVPKILLIAPAIIMQIGVYKSELSDNVKALLSAMITAYSFMALSTMFLTHEEYVFISNDKNTLERLERIQNYLKKNINILNDVDINDFEEFVNNINDNELLKEEISLNFKKL